MVGGINENALLENIEFKIYPTQNRYDACISYHNNKEIDTSGLLEQLAIHSPKVKDLCSEGLDANFKLQPAEHLSDAKLFTKSMLVRFLHIIGSSDVLDKAMTIENEISQLEETQRFRVSLYAKADDNSVASDASKNELLRAMDLRLTALRGELENAFNQAAGTTCSSEGIIEIQMFCDHFGAVDLRKSLQKFVGLREEKQTVVLTGHKHLLPENDPRNDRAGSEERSSQISKPSNSDTPIKYGASPAKAAQIERQSSSEGEESSCTSEEDEPAVDRSRPMIRIASQRRSASPMLRVQIGRSGSPRPTPLTIKSLNYFPAREKLVSRKDEAESNSDEEDSEKKSENNVCRMSVKDAIKLFESKQRDQTVDIQKTKSLLTASIGANKAVLRRWSAGMSEGSKSHADAACVNLPSMISNNLEGQETGVAFVMKLDSDPTPNDHPVEAAVIGAKSDVCEERVASLEEMQDDTVPIQGEEASDKLTASAEWSHQKEAELNQLLMKMMETKPARYKNLAPNDRKDQNNPNEQRGSFYNNYEEQRDKNLEMKLLNSD